MLIKGENYTHVSQWLMEHGELVSRQILSKYCRKHLNVHGAALKKFLDEKKQEGPLGEEVEKNVDLLKPNITKKYLLWYY